MSKLYTVCLTDSKSRQSSQPVISLILDAAYGSDLVPISTTTLWLRRAPEETRSMTDGQHNRDMHSSNKKRKIRHEKTQTLAQMFGDFY